MVRRGKQNIVVAAAVQQAALTAFYASRRFEDIGALVAHGILFPFDMERDGFIISEHGALVLDSQARGRARGAHPPHGGFGVQRRPRST